MSEQLALIKGVGVGLRDVGIPSVWFCTYVSEYEAALQVFSGQEALEKIQEAGLANIKDLEGKVCWVEVKDNQMIFKKFFQS